MSVDIEVISDLKLDEGFRAFAYKDHLGFDTIGYGCCIDPRKTDGIPEPVAEYWLTYLEQQKAAELKQRWPKFHEQSEDVQRALRNMAYQLGVSGVLGFRKMLEALERGDRVAAASEALDSRWARQTPTRAARVAALIRG